MMSEKATPLDPDTCEAIAAFLVDQIKRCGQCDWTRGFEAAISHIKCMAENADKQQPESPAPTPSAGAMRAAREVSRFFGQEPYGDSHDEEALKLHSEVLDRVARHIDRATRLPELVAALREARRFLAYPDILAEPIMAQVDAALAKHDRKEAANDH